MCSPAPPVRPAPLRPAGAATRRAVSCRISADGADLARHHAIRHAVFVREQQLFAHSDHDLLDGAASTLHVLAFFDGRPAGTVRLYPMDEFEPRGAWCGDRLAVVPEYRDERLTTPLLRFAVATVAKHGGSRLMSPVPPADCSPFRRLGWVRRGSSGLHVSTPHVLMETGCTEHVS